MARVSVRPVLLKYLTGNIGEVVHLDTMINDTGLRKTQVQQGMFRLAEAGVVEVVLHSNAWIYRPPQVSNEPPPSETDVDNAVAKTREIADRAETPATASTDLDLFEMVKCLNDGRLLIQDPEGVLYIARKLDA